MAGIPDYIPPEVGRPQPIDPNTEKIPWAVPGPRVPLTRVRPPKTPADHAREILGLAQEAVGEIARDMLDPAGGLVDDRWEKRIKQLRQSRCSDLRGALADELYSDPDTLADLIGDRIADAACGNDAAYNAIVDALAEMCGHNSAMKKACDSVRH